MSSFQLCADEDMEAIFYHLDFSKKCQFRRCSRRWNYLLRSSAVLHTIVFNLASGEQLLSPSKFRRALRRAAPYVVHLALVGADGWSTAKCVANSRNCSLLLNLKRWPASRHHERRLCLCNLDVPYDMLQRYFYNKPAFAWIELRDVNFMGHEVQLILLAALHQDKNLAENEESHPLRQCDSVGICCLGAHLAGCHIVKSPTNAVAIHQEGSSKVGVANATLPATLSGFIRDHMHHLTLSETSQMLKRLHRYEENLVQAVFVWLMAVYEPSLILTAEHSVWTFNYYRCSPLVGRLLACYDGTIDDGDDLLEEEDDIAHGIPMA